MNEYATNYSTYYSDNMANILCYKSSRRNSAKSEVITIHHLISNALDKKVNETRIISQFFDTMETIVHYALQFNHIEMTAWVTASKQNEYFNVNHDLYHGVEKLSYKFVRVKFYSLEECINFVYSIYCLIYPYNKIDRGSLHNSPSMKHLTKLYYNSVFS